MQRSLNRRFTSNIQAQVNYTWSRCLDDESFWGSFNNASAAYVENPFNQNPTDYGVCSYDVTQTLRVNGLFALPFHGNRFVEGWQLSGIFSANSGQPFEIVDGFDDVGLNGGDTPRPNYVLGCNPNAEPNGQRMVQSGLLLSAGSWDLGQSWKRHGQGSRLL